MQTYRGIAVSPGVVIGRAFVVDEQQRKIPKRPIAPGDVARERSRLERALGASIDELGQLRRDAEGRMGPEAAKIFLFHSGMLMDPKLTGPMGTMIESELVTAEYAVYRVLADLAEQFRRQADSIFMTKADDVRDLSMRLLRHLIGEHRSRLAELDREAVIVAQDLTPSQAAAFNRSHALAFATDLGGKTGHTSIVARALGIPAVVGCKTLAAQVGDGVPIIVDGDRGLVVVDPDQDKLDEYHGYIEQRRLFQISLDELSSLPSVTRDGRGVQILGNIEFPEEIPQVLAAGGEGVGLYRTEFLYLANETEPSEEEQFRAYSECVRLLAGLPLTVRTLDLGADKYTQHRTEQPERNPFLGLRSIRYCLADIPMFKRQLRAILRASALGPVKIMFPLITTMSELRQAKYLLNDVMEDLAEEGVAFDRKMPVGMMVEVPSAALLADAFAREVEFFSIGTNDLVQYTLAVDRTNEKVAGLYNPGNPAVVRLIKETVWAAKRRHLPVSCCGESAGELEYALLLIGLGVRTLSVTASSIPHVKRLVRSVSAAQCERIARKAVSFDSDVEVTAYLRDQVRNVLPEAFDARRVEQGA